MLNMILNHEKAKLDKLIVQNNFDVDTSIILKQSRRVDKIVAVCQWIERFKYKRRKEKY